jgi:hypothetical protein
LTHNQTLKIKKYMEASIQWVAAQIFRIVKDTYLSVKLITDFRCIRTL